MYLFFFLFWFVCGLFFFPPHLKSAEKPVHVLLFKSALLTWKLTRQAPPQEMRNVAVLQSIGKAQALVRRSLLFITISLEPDFDSHEKKKNKPHFDGIFMCTRLRPQSLFIKCHIVNWGCHQKLFKYIFLKAITCFSKKYIKKNVLRKYKVTNIYFDLNTEFNLHMLIHRLQEKLKFSISVWDEHYAFADVHLSTVPLIYII